GKLLLSTLTLTHVSRLYPHERLRMVTDRSISAESQLLEGLNVIRRVRYAVQLGENLGTFGGVAVPVYSPTGETLAALTISGPVEDFDPTGLRERLPLVRNTSVAIMEDFRERLNQR